MDIVKAIELALTVKSNWLWKHSVRVANLYSEIGSKLGIIDKDKAYVAGIIHDIGKVLVPDGVLNKESDLTEREWEVMKMHPVWGVNEILDIESFVEFKDLVLYHHECIGGSGYPEGIDLRNLSDDVKLLHIVDRFCALTEDRPYRAKYNKNIAMRLIKNDLVKLFDNHYEIERHLMSYDFLDNKAGILCR